MDTNWTKIYSSGAPYQVELIKGLLEENGIKAISVNKQDSAYLFGEIEIYVSVEDVFKAKQIINKQEEK